MLRWAKHPPNIFACRRYRPNDVNILGIKDNMHLACIPASRTEKVVSDLNKFFPQYIAVPNIFYTSFLDINAFVHPISAILNAGRIELTKGDYDFYWGRHFSRCLREHGGDR